MDKRRWAPKIKQAAANSTALVCRVARQFSGTPATKPRIAAGGTVRCGGSSVCYGRQDRVNKGRTHKLRDFGN